MDIVRGGKGSLLRGENDDTEWCRGGRRDGTLNDAYFMKPEFFLSRTKDEFLRTKKDFSQGKKAMALAMVMTWAMNVEKKVLRVETRPGYGQYVRLAD